jgi:hypothetical protein
MQCSLEAYACQMSAHGASFDVSFDVAVFGVFGLKIQRLPSPAQRAGSVLQMVVRAEGTPVINARKAVLKTGLLAKE